MAAFSLSVQLRSGSPITADGVTDLVEAVLEELDTLGYLASVSTTGTGALVSMTVTVDTDDADDLAGLRDFTAAVVAALHAAGVGGGGSILAGAPNVTSGQLQNA
jgi:hypothetical protein